MRLAVLSDIHGNMEAFRAVLSDMESIGVEKMLNLGDIVGYGPNPEECVQLVRDLNIPTVLGNHEHATLDPRHKRWFNSTSRSAVDMTDGMISDSSRNWFQTLPLSIAFGGLRFVHGYPPENLHLYLFGVGEERLVDTFTKNPERIFFLGHTHDLEYVRWDGETVSRGPLELGVMELDEDCRYMLNVGSVGQPRDDYDARAKYAVYDLEASTCEIRAVDYDREATARRIRECGIPETYADRLLR